jgi:hypothetical protein
LGVSIVGRLGYAHLKRDLPKPGELERT